LTVGPRAVVVADYKAARNPVRGVSSKPSE
jgi:hypothetical protein